MNLLKHLTTLPTDNANKNTTNDNGNNNNNNNDHNELRGHHLLTSLVCFSSLLSYIFFTESPPVYVQRRAQRRRKQRPFDIHSTSYNRQKPGGYDKEAKRGQAASGDARTTAGKRRAQRGRV